MMNIVSYELATADDQPTIILRVDLSIIQINLAAIAFLELEDIPFEGRHIVDAFTGSLQPISKTVLQTTRDGITRSTQNVRVFDMSWKMSIHRLGKYWVVRIDDRAQTIADMSPLHEQQDNVVHFQY